MIKRLGIFFVALASFAMFTTTASAQLPSPTYGLNLGNTLEAPCGVGCWSPLPTQALINAFAAAGFNTVRLPCAWNSESNSSGTISTFMSQVKQVVDWCYAKGLYVIINDHWDNGWFENNAFSAYDSSLNSKLANMWTQVANTFKAYDNHLLFACANEPNASSQVQTNILFQYYQTFVTTVRNTGGNNSIRWLVLQAPSASIDNAYNNTLNWPTDTTSGRLMLEVHDYDPFQFCGLSSDASWGAMFYFWGSGYHSTTLPSRNATWGEESYMAGQCDKMKSKFASKGIPVLFGEWGAGPKPAESDLTGANITLNYDSCTYWNKTMHDYVNSRGMYATYWNTPGGLFDWTTGKINDQTMVNAVRGVSAVPPPGGSTYSSGIANGNHSLTPQNATGSRLDANGGSSANGTKVQIWSGSGQTWAFTNKGSGIYQMAEAASTGACLDVTGFGGSGANVEIWACSGGTNQQWGAVSISGNIYGFAPQNATGTRLDVSGNGTANGTQVDIWTSNGGNNQKWAVN